MVTRRNRVLHDELSVQPGQSNRRSCGTNVHTQNPGTPAVQTKKRWLATAGKVSHRTFLDPPLSYQLLRNCRNGAALQAGVAGKIGARNRLMLSNEIEDNAAIDVASRFAGCDLKIA
jgi:hypothetical protein